MPFTFLTSPTNQSAVPGQDTTFTAQASTNDYTSLSTAYTYQWFLSSGATRTPIAQETNASYTIDPLMEDNGKVFFVTSTLLTGAPATTFVQRITSANVFLTVAEDVPPFDVYDLGSETGRERHRRLRLLGYV
jgi:hypothetical protein